MGRGGKSGRRQAKGEGVRRKQAPPNAGPPTAPSPPPPGAYVAKSLLQEAPDLLFP